MFAYYLRLALTSLRRTPVLTALMVLAVAVGIGASMTALTVLRAMGNNPYAYKNDLIYVPQMDNWGAQSAYDDDGNPPNQVTYRDARALTDAAKADLQSAMYSTGLAIRPDNDDLRPFLGRLRAAATDFFPLSLDATRRAAEICFKTRSAPWSSSTWCSGGRASPSTGVPLTISVCPEPPSGATRPESIQPITGPTIRIAASLRIQRMVTVSMG